MATKSERRRKKILEAAAYLFAERGYSNVGVDDIGEAVGVTGPAVYYYFSGKQAVLAALFEEGLLGILQDAEDARREQDPQRAAADLVERHVARALKQRATSRLTLTSFDALPAEDVPRLRSLQHRYMKHWAELLQALDPSADRAQCRARAIALLGMLNAVVLWDVSSTLVTVQREVVAMALKSLGLDPSLAGQRPA
ncbi:TetR/AcrR family transcriptional regulator [Nocardioides endophyticus]|uniref:TetR/AcrR family transcriptional regulator n=1 Tax=Nocardioides endophyticus TaxID=1353775 RepID=A0ABP8YGT3_9ACTN